MAPAILILLSGAAALSWEVLWQIHASLPIGVSALGTAITLVSTMGGMTLGALVAGRLLRGRVLARPLRIYGLLEVAIGLAGVLALQPGFLAPSSEPLEDCSHAVGAKSETPSSNPDKPSKHKANPSLLAAPAKVTACTDASSKPSWRPSTSYGPWAELLRHCFDVNVLDGPRCHSRLTPVAVIRRQQVIDRILQHPSPTTSRASSTMTLA